MEEREGKGGRLRTAFNFLQSTLHFKNALPIPKYLKEI
jgi:hypothetical protein